MDDLIIKNSHFITSMKKKHLAILLPNLRGGGAERISVNLANSFVGQGYAVDMVLLLATGEFLEDLRPEINIVDLQVKRMRGTLPPLIRYLRQTKPDAMLTCMWPLTFLSVIARKLASASTRLVVAEHITWSFSQVEYPPLQRFFIKKTMHFFFPNTDAIVAVSNGAADDLAHFAGLPRNSIITVYNPVIDTTIRSANEPSVSELVKWTLAPHRILSVGTLKKQKNHKLLIHAFSILLTNINAHLLILGEGVLRKELELLIDELDIKSNISMPGFVKNTQPYYQHADLFALSSDWEGLPTVLIEAIATGTPVVSTDCPSGAREILNDGQFGHLVPVGDAIALAAAMKESLTTSHDPIALKTRAQIFGINKAFKEYEKLLFPPAMNSKGI